MLRVDWYLERSGQTIGCLFFFECFALKIRATISTELFVTNYQSTQRNIPTELRHQPEAISDEECVL